MGWKGNIGVPQRGVIALAIALGVATPAFAEVVGALNALLAAVTVSSTHSNVKGDYADLLGVDQRVTVRLATQSTNCTGTLISPTWVLTAAHCVQPNDPTGGVNIDGISSVRAFAHKGFDYRAVKAAETNPEESVQINPYDIAVVEFPPQTADFLGVKKFPAIAKDGLDEGHGYVGGFGLSSVKAVLGKERYGGAGLKRWGVVNIVGREDGYLISDIETVYLNEKRQEKADKKLGKAKFSHCLPGDSGGAIYNEMGEIAGVVSVMSLNATGDESIIRLPTPILGLSIPFYLTTNHRYLIGNLFMDITSNAASEMLAMTDVGTSAASPAVAANPMSSETYSLSAPLSPRERLARVSPFNNVKLQTGIYGDGKTQVAVVPYYSGSSMVSAELYDDLTSPTPKPVLFGCEGSFCLSVDETQSLVVRNGEMVRMKRETQTYASFLGLAGKPEILGRFTLQ